MFKKLLVILFLLYSTHSAYAQLVKVSVGLRGNGVATLSNTELRPKTFVEFGGGGGLFAGIKIGKVAGIQAEADYRVNSASYLQNGSSEALSVMHQYLDIPICLQLWCSRSFAFELGYQQSVALSGNIKLPSAEPVEDKGILDYGSLVAGLVINMGKVVFLNIRYTQSLGYTYVMTTEPNRNMSLQIGLGFRLFNSKQSAFK